MSDPILIQPVESPVICKPYYEPTQYWEYDRNTGRAQKMEGRRTALRGLPAWSCSLISPRQVAERLAVPRSAPQAAPLHP